MIVLSAYRFRLEPNGQQNDRLSQFAGCMRLVWNKNLELQKGQLDQKKKVFSYAESCKALTQLKREISFLKDVHSQPLQQILKDQDLALKNFLAGSKSMPRFKKKGRHDSFRFPQGVKVDQKKIYLPKIGWVKFRKSREIEGTIKNVTVSRTAGKWHVSIQVEREIEEPKHQSVFAVGIDLGVALFATLSDGQVFMPVDSFKVCRKKLAKQQSSLARKVKGSENWKKQKSAIQKTHVKIANKRKDYLHKLSTKISKSHVVICLEDLKVQNMTRSAKGTQDKPGKNVAAKSGLNRSILDQGWYEFKRQLMYKQAWRGGHVVLVDPKYSSQKCSNCGFTSAENRRTQANFNCIGCNYVSNADVNAAKNILAAGRAVIACGDIGQDAA
ncbi:MAG: transposase [Candidatus Melainabacteria bacterium]|nr:transposase [Candidatus Melainabacteria bacterium]